MTDTDQFEEFLRSYQDMVWNTAHRLLGNETDAQDVSQQVFLRAWEHFEDLRGSPTAGGWLKTVARNLCLNHLQRYRARWRFFSEFTTDEDNPSEERELPFASAETLEGELLTADQREVIEEVLAKLPTDQRTALVLYHFEDMDYVDIARQLGVSLGKVKTDIHRARATLKKKLQPKAEELGV